VTTASAPPAPQQSARVSEIVTAADALVRADGFEVLTMRRLSEAVGIQAPSLYKHLPNKAAVRTALVERALRHLGGRIHQAVAEADAGDRIRALLACYRDCARADPHLYRLATSGALERGSLPDGLEAWAGQPFFLVTGEPYLAQALWAAAHGTAILELDGRYLPGSELDRTWAALAAAFTAAATATLH
jgi:AcrR family transcriptional regulator